jgi:hypothetical protein
MDETVMYACMYVCNMLCLFGMIVHSITVHTVNCISLASTTINHPCKMFQFCGKISLKQFTRIS